MTWLIWKVRTWFCKHDFDKEETVEDWWSGANYFKTVRVSATCKRCDWHRSYWKFR